MSYIGELQIDGGAQLPIGSTLYGICEIPAATAAKVVTLSNFDTLINGVTVHVRFSNGNSADNNITLKVGSTDAKPVSNPGGSFAWSSNSVISFTYDGTNDTWITNDGNVSQISILNTYDSTSTNAISGQGVADALDDLGEAADKDVITEIIETGANANKTSTDLPTTAAITSYIDAKTAGLTSAMHFIGRTVTTMSDGLTVPTVVINGNSYTPNPGDVVLSSDYQEYVWVETNSTTHAGYWELLGDEGSYAFRDNTENVVKTVTFTPDVPGQLSTKDTAIPTISSLGTATQMEVNQGVLQITLGTVPTRGTDINIKEVDVWTRGTAASLNTTTQNVVIP